MERFKRQSIVNQFKKSTVIYHLQRLLTFLTLCFITSSIDAQTLDSRGTEFWLTFSRNHTGSTVQPSLFVSSSTAATVTVQVPFLEFNEVLNLEPNIAQPLNLPNAVELLSNDTVTNEGILVTSDAEVSVYGLSRMQFTTDAYLGLPVDVLGTEYLVSAWPGANNGPSQYAIVATEDNTTVSLTPSLAEQECFAATEITMNRGDTYMHEGCNEQDVTGTLITSSAPVAVFGGHQCANVPDLSTSFCDHLIEQIPPIQAWGTQFITAPLASRIGGDTFRVIASENNTNVFLNNESVAVLSRGEVFETLIDGAATLSASAPVLVVQFSNGTTFDNVTSDPFKMIIPPFEQFLDDYTFSVPTEGFASNFVNVVVDENQAALLELDGQPIAAENFQAIENTNFVFAQIPIALGNHNLTGAVAGIFTYGYDEFDSYGYPGGLSLSEVASVEAVGLLSNTLMVMADGMACTSALVTDQEQLPLQDIRVDFEVTLILETTNGSARTDEQGIAEFCIDADPNQSFESATVRVSVGGFSEEASVDVIVARIIAEIELLAEEISAAVGSNVAIPIMILDQDGMPLAETTIDFSLLINGEVISGSATSDEEGVATLNFVATQALEPGMFSLTFSSGEFESQQALSLEFTEGTEIDGEIVSGAGSSGALTVMLLALLGVFRMRSPVIKGRLTRALTLLAALLTLVAPVKADAGWYAGLKLGQAEYVDVQDNVAPVIAATGDDLNFSIDDSNTGYELFAGYKFTRFISARLSFINLDEYSVQVRGTSSDPDALGEAINNALNPAVQGFTLGAAGHIGVGEQITLEPRAGLLIYDSEQDANIAGISNTVDDAGLGYTLGGSVLFNVNQNLQLGIGYDAYWSEEDDLIAHFYSAQLQYYFNQ